MAKSESETLGSGVPGEAMFEVVSGWGAADGRRALGARTERPLEVGARRASTLARLDTDAARCRRVLVAGATADPHRTASQNRGERAGRDRREGAGVAGNALSLVVPGVALPTDLRAREGSGGDLQCAQTCEGEGEETHLASSTTSMSRCISRAASFWTMARCRAAS